jgi:hypothetical protein
MTPKTPPAEPSSAMSRPKSDAALERSAQALRENLLKRKAQSRARTAPQHKPASEKQQNGG